jgi:hypothetical protein
MRKRKRKSTKSKKRPKKKRKIGNSDNDIVLKDTEYKLQKAYHEWETDEYPYIVSSGTPYVGMRDFRTITKVKKKGYLKGYPDYVKHDPRMWFEENEYKIRIKVVPSEFFEFKNTQGTGVVSEEQEHVLSALDRRGYGNHVVNDLEKAKQLTIQHKTGYPLYKGWIEIDKRDFSIILPSAPKKVILPRGDKWKNRNRYGSKLKKTKKGDDVKKKRSRRKRNRSRTDKKNSKKKKSKRKRNKKK